MKRLVFLSTALALLSLVLTNNGFAQSSRLAAGSFEAATKDKASIQGSYSLKSAYDNHIILKIVPSNPVELNTRIVNAAGEEVLKIAPEQVSLRYVKNLDVSELAPGEYFIEISGDDTEKKTRIPFTR